MRVLAHYIKQALPNLDGSCKAEMESEIKEYEKNMAKLQKVSYFIEKGIEPYEKRFDSLLGEYLEFKRSVFECFVLDDNDRLTIDTEKLYERLSSEAREWHFEQEEMRA
jgi:hypothetical protein